MEADYQEITESSEELVQMPRIGFFSLALFPVFVFFFLGSLLFFDILQRLAWLFGQWLSGLNAQQKVVNLLNHALLFCLRLVGTRINYSGLENIPQDEGPLLIVSNHQSLFDMPIIHTTFSKFFPRYIAKQELGRWLPSVSFNLRCGGSALIDRSNARQAIPALNELAARMEDEKFAVVIFPEGTRAKRGVLKKFRPSGLASLIKHSPNARIVPVVIDGTWKLSAYPFGPIPFGTTVRLAVLPSLKITPTTEAAEAKQLHTLIEQGLAQIHQKKLS